MKTESKFWDLVVIGGGAAGFFAAITAAERRAGGRVLVLEKTGRCLSKVAISGGGRCNVTNSEVRPDEVVRGYPRGHRELRGPLHRFGPQETIGWFEERGCALKTEADGRVFPVTDDSGSVIRVLEGEARRKGVIVRTRVGVKAVRCRGGGGFEIGTGGELDGEIVAQRIVVAVGGLKGSPLLGFLERVGHTIAPLSPSLFTFRINDPRLRDLAGLSVPKARIELPDLPPVRGKGMEGARVQDGPVLVTHWGLSGPAVLRLSAWAARDLAPTGYHFPVCLRWTGDLPVGRVEEILSGERKRNGKRRVRNAPWEGIPKRLWGRLVEVSGIDGEKVWGQVSREQFRGLAENLAGGIYRVAGKSTNKEEFVTAGGVTLKEIDFRTMESRMVPGLYVVGESLDIDGVTGGFNLQSAWTTGRICGEAVATLWERAEAG